jgi:hypothetical protein
MDFTGMADFDKPSANGDMTDVESRWREFQPVKTNEIRSAVESGIS